MSLLLEGKRAFITGGTRGIGAALCETFAREGADVAFNYNSRDDLADETKSKIESHGRRGRPFKVSITDRFGMKHLTRELVQEWGGIDILVNNAGVGGGGPIEEAPLDVFRQIMETNFFGALRCIKAVLPSMRERRAGCIVNVTSVSGRFGMTPQGAYASSKWALEGLSECLAQETKPFGIRVGIVEPGVIATPMTVRSRPAPPPSTSSSAAPAGT